MPLLTHPLTRRRLLASASASAVGAALFPATLLAADISNLYRRAVVIDGLGGPGGSGPPGQEWLQSDEVQHVRDSGLSAVHMTLGSVGTEPPLEAFEAIIRDIARWDAEIERHPDALAAVRQAEDIEVAVRTGKTGLIYGLQDGVSFEDDLDRLQALKQLGIRVIQPTYNRRNLLGDGCMEPSDAGLSRTGIQAIEQIHELRILLDLSHCGRQTTADALAVSTRPVSFTHTGCYALAEHPRHRTDQEIRAVADTGGVIGIYVMPYLARGKQPTAADVIAHLDHAIQVAGEDHVALGTDGSISPVNLTDEYRENFRSITRKRKELGIAAPFETEEGYLFASDLNTARRFETLAEMLHAKGYTDDRIEKVLGANLLRVFRDSWAS